jgi:hypothetical protein
MIARTMAGRSSRLARHTTTMKAAPMRRQDTKSGEHGRRGDTVRAARRWREMLGEFLGIRQVFHALYALGEGQDATGLLEFAARRLCPRTDQALGREQPVFRPVPVGQVTEFIAD